MAVYTDIAAELWQKNEQNVPKGVRVETRYAGDVTVTRVDIRQKGLARRPGRYVTVDMPHFAYIDHRARHYVGAIAHELKNMLPPAGEILVAGLGERTIAADALGPAVCSRVFVTRHIPVAEDERELIRLRQVTAVCPGTEGRTGLSPGETLGALVKAIRPAAVLCVDSLATSDPARLGCTVQITDTGICPGGEERKRLDSRLLGVPVIGMGVPTVMDAAEVCPAAHRLVVTPKEIDLIIDRAARVLSLAINRALQKELSVGELQFITC